MPRSLFVDWPSNTGNPKIQLTLLAFRSCQTLMGDIKNPKTVSYPAVLLYRLITEVVLGMELRPTTKVGAPLTIHHGFSLVVNPDAVIGDRVQLRNGVVIGNRTPGGVCPRIEDDVEVGAGAVIIGGVTVGKGARVGAAAVVIADVPAHAAVVGNPGRVILPQVSE